MKHTLQEISTLSNRNERFRAQTALFAEFLESEGIRKAPHTAPELPDFSSLGAPEKEEAIRAIQLSLEVFQEAVSAGDRLQDTPQLIWRTLRKLGWTPPSDAFDRIVDGDVVEIYSTSMIAVFRNFAFYEFTNYSIEALFSRPLHELTTRDPEIMERIYAITRKFTEREIAGTVDPGIEEHFCRETSAPDPLEFMIHVKFISGLTSGGETVGFLSGRRIKIS